jgi:erythromycin esterase
MRINLILIVLLANFSTSYSQSSYSAVFNFNLNDTLLLNEISSNARVIGIGESAHGSGSIIRIRNEVIKKLILDYNFKNIILESEFWGTQSLNKYIHNEYNGPVDSAFLEMGVGVWMNKEMLDLLNWIRDYNNDKSDSLKVSLYGCDVWGLYAIAKYFKDHPWILANLSKESISTLNSISTIPNWRYSNTGKKATENLYSELLEKCKSNTFKSIEENYLTQLIGYAIAKSKKNGGYKEAALRNKIMANTVMYLSEQKPYEKFVIIAHNGHILKSRNSTYIYPMGKHLYKKLGDQYRAIGITFLNGSILSYNNKNKKNEIIEVSAPKTNSIESNLQLLKFDVGYLNIDVNKDDSLVKKKIYMRSIGQVYSERHLNYTKQKLPKGFNILLIVKKSIAPNSIYGRK